jgi:hypothetical protein
LSIYIFHYKDKHLNSSDFHESAFYKEIDLLQLQDNSINTTINQTKKNDFFYLNFKPEDCATIKSKLAQLEPKGAYTVQSNHQFREEYIHQG